jgi:protein O-GlcNAc transferase
MSKVISFSLWGNDPKYTEGAVRNAEIAAELFPDWECWLYCGTSVDDDFYRNFNIELHEEFDGKTVLYGHNLQIHILDEPGDWRGMFWRFEPASDPNVEVMISRDCDSRLSQREKAAIDAWMESDKGFHTIHDHAYHTVPILGGLWGKKRDCLPEFGVLLSQWKQEDRWQTDQEFLTQSIWPLVHSDTLNHAEFHVNIWHGESIPMHRNGREFIGATYNENDVIDPEQQRLLYGG